MDDINAPFLDARVLFLQPFLTWITPTFYKLTFTTKNVFMNMYQITFYYLELSSKCIKFSSIEVSVHE